VWKKPSEAAAIKRTDNSLDMESPFLIYVILKITDAIAPSDGIGFRSDIIS